MEADPKQTKASAVQFPSSIEERHITRAPMLPTIVCGVQPPQITRVIGATAYEVSIFLKKLVKKVIYSHNLAFYFIQEIKYKNTPHQVGNSIHAQIGVRFLNTSHFAASISYS